MASPDYVPDVDLTKVTAYGDSKVWAAGGNTILRTRDGGATSTNQLPAGYEGIRFQGVHTPDGETAWVTSNDPTDGCVVILKSTDAGLAWARQSGDGGTVIRKGSDGRGQESGIGPGSRESIS